MDLLIVDDDDEFRSLASTWMTRKGHQVFQAGDPQTAITLVQKRNFNVAILDLNLGETSGLDLLEALRMISEELEIIFLTGQGSVSTAVEAMKKGACDYLTKPFPLAELEERCAKAAGLGHLRRDRLRWKTLAQRTLSEREMVYESGAMQEVHRLIRRIAPTDAPVLIHGETGTGKEVAARIIQRLSLRAEQPFVTINCAALPDQLVESELFGHEKGSFTGAAAARPGLFEIADEGTLFIDEIGELPLGLQPKLLRVLEDGSFRRVGSSRESRTNVRIIAATNRDLAAEVRANRFREDLLYRINVLPLTMPPLREHAQDIQLLAQHFLPPGWEIEPEALNALATFPWPGNVRQLKNVIERAVILSESQTITLDDLPAEISLATPEPESFIPPNETPSTEVQLEKIERDHIVEVLERCRGNKAQAARMLGIHRRKLYRLLDRHGLT